MPERFLYDDAAAPDQICLRQALDGRREQERRDLQIEHRALRVLDRFADALVGAGISKVAGHVGESRREPLEDRLVELLASRGDRLAGTLYELINCPVAGRHAD